MIIIYIWEINHLFLAKKKYSFEGYFDIKETYRFIKSYLEDSRHYDIAEKDYEEKNDSGSRKIMSKNEAEQQFNDYYKIILKYELNMSGTDVEVKVNDNKVVLMTKGKASLVVNGYVEKDFNEIRPKGGVSSVLDKVYDKFFRGSELEKCQMSAANDVDGLILRFKQQMNSTLK